MKKIVILSIVFFSLSSLFAQVDQDEKDIFIVWFGHACFEISYGGKNIVIDPFNPEWMNYALPKDKIDYAFSSHAHGDHNFFAGIDVEKKYKASGITDEFTLEHDSEVISLKGKTTEKIGENNFAFWTVPSFHDKKKGEDRGPNGIICLEIGGLKIVHLGDLGHLLSKDHKEKIGKVDILMIPIGGYYTIDSSEAKEIVNLLEPRIVLPMHYKTDKLSEDFPISNEKEFLKGFDNVKKEKNSFFTVNKKNLPEKTEIIVLKYFEE